MNKPNDIHNIFTTWGKGQRQLSARNEELKKAVLARIPTAPHSTARVPAYRLPWLSFAFGGLAVLTLLLNPGGVKNRSMPTAGVAPASEGGRVSMPELPVAVRDGDMVANQSSVAPEYSYGKMMPGYYPQPTPTVPVTDTREFLQTDYNVTIKTRNVQELTRRAETTVRGFGGRVDGSSSSEKWGSVSFVLPASKFEAFRDEIESFTSPRFTTIETRTENLLPQKQSIEEQKKQIEKNAAQYRAERKSLIAGHASTVASLQTKLSNVAYELTQLRVEQTTDAVRRAYINARIAELVTEQSGLQTRLASENSYYSRQLNELDARIKDTESGLEWVATADKNLIDTVATVRGTISLNWISIGEVIELYVSTVWITIFFVVAAIGAAFWSRRRYKLETF
jgi:hypothetical protein